MVRRFLQHFKISPIWPIHFVTFFRSSKKRRHCQSGILMTYLNISNRKMCEYDLGVGVAKMHIHNRQKSNSIEHFGFHVDTCCGSIAYTNTWNDNWPDFYFQQRLTPLVDRINNAELSTHFCELVKQKNHFYDKIKIYPSLVHGDLWSGNYNGVEDGVAIYDPGAFYAHDEFEFGMIDLFGGLGQKFYDGYRTIIPEAPGFRLRVKLYKLFHLLNHWAHFGGSYKNSSLNLLKSLLK